MPEAVAPEASKLSPGDPQILAHSLGWVGIGQGDGEDAGILLGGEVSVEVWQPGQGWGRRAEGTISQAMPEPAGVGVEWGEGRHPAGPTESPSSVLHVPDCSQSNTRAATVRCLNQVWRSWQCNRWLRVPDAIPLEFWPRVTSRVLGSCGLEVATK